MQPACARTFNYNDITTSRAAVLNLTLRHMSCAYRRLCLLLALVQKRRRRIVRGFSSRSLVWRRVQRYACVSSTSTFKQSFLLAVILQSGAVRRTVRLGSPQRRDAPSAKARMAFGSNGFSRYLPTFLHWATRRQSFLRLQFPTRLQMWRRNCDPCPVHLSRTLS